MESLDYWRKFFRSTGSDIVDVIEHAITVANSDCPEELRRRRDRITEKLYASRTPCSRGCCRGELMKAAFGAEEEDEEEEGAGSVRKVCAKGSKAGSSSSGGGGGSVETKELDPAFSHYSYNEAEALTEEIEEESQTVGEVLRIKEVLTNHDESDDVLFDSLRRLQLMHLSVETLKVTDIGRAVNVLRKHGSKQIRQLVRTLIENWKVLVDEWVSATAAIADNSPASVAPVEIDEEEGLPSPPLDEGVFFTTAPIQLSKFFDGMDDDGNIRTAEFDENQESRKRSSGNYEPLGKQQVAEDKGWNRRQEQVIRQVKPLEASHGHARSLGIDGGELRRQELAVRQTKPNEIVREGIKRQPMSQDISNKQTKLTAADCELGGAARLSAGKKTTSEIDAGFLVKTQDSFPNKQSKHNTINSGPGRPQNLSSEKKTTADMTDGIQKKQSAYAQDRMKNSEEGSLRTKLEAAKRKLQENYQQAQNAKKQRTIQVMELNDIPKRAHIIKQPVQKPKSNIRNLLSKRR